MLFLVLCLQTLYGLIFEVDTLYISFEEKSLKMCFVNEHCPS